MLFTYPIARKFMKGNQISVYIKDVIENMPADWLKLTTHRLDIYDEAQAKTQFLEQFEILYNNNHYKTSALDALPTAYDYIRLGHPLSCILEWAIAKSNNLGSDHVISFSSKTTPILAILRKNLIDNKHTQIYYADELPEYFDVDLLRSVYGYNLEVTKVEGLASIPEYDIVSTEGSTIFVSKQNKIGDFDLQVGIDFFVNLHADLGSTIVVNGEQNEKYISEIQHVRRRETISMTPANCLLALKAMIGDTIDSDSSDIASNKALVLKSIREITGVETKALVGSSGLSIQYAIMMGLIHDANENYKGKAIKFIVPPNCYGGTNDQARRIAACIENVEVVDLPVDGDNEMVQSIDRVLNDLAKKDAVPYIIAEIPTNPRVEVPDLLKLKATLGKDRKNKNGDTAIDPVFILDQTFCPNYHFLGEGKILSTVKAISYASGSKFPSGGRCTAGYCVSNNRAASLLDQIETHLLLCDNEATSLQYETLAVQLPSMNQRINDAYINTRAFVNFIEETLPAAKINFVSEALANQGFTPSVFSLDLPTKGKTVTEQESYKKELNQKLINLMITEIPEESKYCVSYGQLKGCYWTIPATSTQGTTREGDKDYIARVALSPDMDLELHKQVFKKFVDSI